MQESNNPLISVVITCYNQGAYLEDALNSVLSQTYKSWECFIINDGSVDNSQSIADMYAAKDNRFIAIYQSNGGVAAARNNGIKQAKGAFIQFLDADDILENEKFERQTRFFHAHPDVDVLYSSSRYFFHDQPASFYAVHFSGDVPTVEMHYKDANQKDVLFHCNVATICSTMYKRKVFDVVSGFEGVVFEDWLFHLQLALNGFKFHFERLDNSCSLIRLTNNSQLIRHSHANKKTNAFFDRIQQLEKEHNYVSSYRVNLPQERNDRGTIKWVLELLIPPIFIRVYHYFKHRR